MFYEDLIVLIPSHSLEDFPAEIGEDDAASLLNSFAVAWHPVLLAGAKVLPRWHRADDPPTQHRSGLSSCRRRARAGSPRAGPSASPAKDVRSSAGFPSGRR